MQIKESPPWLKQLLKRLRESGIIKEESFEDKINKAINRGIWSDFITSSLCLYIVLQQYGGELTIVSIILERNFVQSVEQLVTNKDVQKPYIHVQSSINSATRELEDCNQAVNRQNPTVYCPDNKTVYISNGIVKRLALARSISLSLLDSERDKIFDYVTEVALNKYRTSALSFDDQEKALAEFCLVGEAMNAKYQGDGEAKDFFVSEVLSSKYSYILGNQPITQDSQRKAFAQGWNEGNCLINE